MEKQPKRLLEIILEYAIIFALSAFLVKLGVCYLLCVWPALLIIATVVIGSVIAYRIWKRNRDSDW